MKRSVLILAGLGALAVGLVVYLPAAIVADWAESSVPGLRISGVDGTALDGRASRVLYNDLPLEDLSWSVRPWSLLLARAGADISVATDAGGLEATVNRSLLGDGLRVSNLAGAASIEWVARRAGYTFVPVSGRIRADIARLALDAGGGIVSARGHVEADGLRWELLNPPAPLGRAAAAIDATDGTATVKITDSDGPLALDGDAELQKNGTYRLNLRLRARGEADPRLKKLLTELGETDSEGWYRIAERGRL